MFAYKLFRERKDGSLGPLFINRSQRIPINEWLTAEDHPTKGYAHRPGWHAGAEARAPHLSEKGRVWYRVEIKDFYEMTRPEHQGTRWFIAKRMRVVNRVTEKIYGRRADTIIIDDIYGKEIDDAIQL